MAVLAIGPGAPDARVRDGHGRGPRRRDAAGGGCARAGRAHAGAARGAGVPPGVGGRRRAAAHRARAARRARALAVRHHGAGGRRAAPHGPRARGGPARARPRSGRRAATPSTRCARCWACCGRTARRRGNPPALPARAASPSSWSGRAPTASPSTTRASPRRRREVPERLAGVVHRTLQEALTNVRRHAPGASVQVRLVVGRRGSCSRCVDDGPGADDVGRGLRPARHARARRVRRRDARRRSRADGVPGPARAPGR